MAMSESQANLPVTVEDNTPSAAVSKDPNMALWGLGTVGPLLILIGILMIAGQNSTIQNPPFADAIAPAWVGWWVGIGVVGFGALTTLMAVTVGAIRFKP
jgi:hypothetical protein